MDKYILVATGAGLDLFGHQAYTIFFQPHDCGGEVRYFQADMVQAFAAFGDEFCDR